MNTIRIEFVGGPLDGDLADIPSTTAVVSSAVGNVEYIYARREAFGLPTVNDSGYVPYDFHSGHAIGVRKA